MANKHKGALRGVGLSILDNLSHGGESSHKWGQVRFLLSVVAFLGNSGFDSFSVFVAADRLEPRTQSDLHRRWKPDNGTE